MHQSSEQIGTIAAALARAQADLTNPEKTLTVVIRSPFRGRMIEPSATRLWPRVWISSARR